TDIQTGARNGCLRNAKNGSGGRRIDDVTTWSAGLPRVDRKSFAIGRPPWSAYRTRVAWQKTDAEYPGIAAICAFDDKRILNWRIVVQIRRRFFDPLVWKGEDED